PRDLRRRQPAQQPQRQRHPRRHRQRRMAAREHQPEPLVPHDALLDRLHLVHQDRLRLPALPRGLPPQPVDRPVPRRRDDPPRGARRRPRHRPPPHRLGERVLHRLLGDVDVAEHPDQHRHGPAVLLPEDPLDQISPWNGRTSIGRPVARVYRAAIFNAASRSSTSTITSPPMNSLPSVHGPSVATTSSPFSRTTVLAEGSCSGFPKTHFSSASRSRRITDSSFMIFSSSSGGGLSPTGWIMLSAYSLMLPPCPDTSRSRPPSS